jgi:hypothetical protein
LIIHGGLVTSSFSTHRRPPDPAKTDGARPADSDGVGGQNWIDFHAGPAGGSATRHMCAAARMNRPFRNAVIAELIENPHRIPAPAPGVDMARVLEECLKARREKVAAGIALIAILVIARIWIPGAIQLAARLGLICGGVLTLLLTAKAVLVPPRSLDPGGYRLSRWRALRSLAVLIGQAIALGLLVYLVAEIAAVAETGRWLHSLVRVDLHRLRKSHWLQWLHPRNWMLWRQRVGRNQATLHALIVLLLVFAVGTRMRFRDRRAFRALKSRTEAPRSRWFRKTREVLSRLDARPAESETPYAVSSPFVGSGKRLEEQCWSFPVELRPRRAGPNGARVREMDVPMVHRAVADGLTALGVGSSYPGDMLHGLIVRDRVFRNALRSDPLDTWYGTLSEPDSLSGQQVLKRGVADALDRAAHQRLRRYLEVRTDLWDEQLVATVFIRAYVQGGLLQLEGIAYVLRPIAARYRAIDHLAPVGPLRDAAAACAGAVTHVVSDVYGVLLETFVWLNSVLRARQRRRWHRQMAEGGFAVDYSPRTGLRELVEGSGYAHPFQQMDVQRFFTAVRERAFSAVGAELEQAGYDTSDFEKMVRVVNNSLNVNFGGVQNVNARVTGNQAGAGHGSVDQKADLFRTARGDSLDDHA